MVVLSHILSRLLPVFSPSSSCLLPALFLSSSRPLPRDWWAHRDSHPECWPSSVRWQDPSGILGAAWIGVDKEAIIVEDGQVLTINLEVIVVGSIEEQLVAIGKAIVNIEPGWWSRVWRRSRWRQWWSRQRAAGTESRGKGGVRWRGACPPAPGRHLVLPIVMHSALHSVGDKPGNSCFVLVKLNVEDYYLLRHILSENYQKWL